MYKTAHNSGHIVIVTYKKSRLCKVNYNLVATLTCVLDTGLHNLLLNEQKRCVSKQTHWFVWNLP